jgi:hypothetical protein
MGQPKGWLLRSLKVRKRLGPKFVCDVRAK